MANGNLKTKGPSPTDFTEERSRNILREKLPYEKATFQWYGDKNPNLDGHIEFLKADGGSTSVRLFFQLKGTDRPEAASYDCDKEFINYCYQAHEPIALILVNIPQNKVYWRLIYAITQYSTGSAIVPATSQVAEGNPQTPTPPAPAAPSEPPPAPAPISAPSPAINPTPPPASAPAPKPKGQYTDGSYTGSPADAYYGMVQIQVSIQGGKIASVDFLQYPNDRRTSQYINSQAMPYLKQEAIQAQSANVDIVSGATDTSMAFQRSLADALARAKI